MATRRKPFEQYRTLLPDGRSVVSVVIFEPESARVWIVAESRSDALRQIREYGAPNPHVDSDFRPGHRLAEAAAADPSLMIFVEDSSEHWPKSVLPSELLAEYLRGESLPR